MPNPYPRLTYVRTVYGDRFRVSLEELESPRVLLWRYNQQGRRVSSLNPRGSQCHRGNIIGPWPGCVNDLPSFERRMDRIAAGLERA